MKNLTFFLFFILIFLSVPDALAQDERKTETIQSEVPQIVLSISDNSVRIQNATDDAVMEIYNILGVKVKAERIDSPDKTIDLDLPKGYYILKIGTIVRKLIIK